MLLVGRRCFVLEPARAVLEDFVVHGRKVLTNHSESCLIVVAEGSTLGLPIVRGGLVNLGTFLFVDPGHSSCLEVSAKLSLLPTLDLWLAPPAIDELGTQHLSHVLRLKQFNPHLSNYYN